MPDAPPRPPIPPCPRCGATPVVRNGLTHSGTPAFRCRGCNRRLVAAPGKGPIPDPTRDRIRRLLAERRGVRAIARVTGVSRSWLPGVVNRLLRDDTPRARAAPRTSGRVAIDADKLRSAVGGKRDVWWAWVASGADTRQVVGMVAGDRSAATAQWLWDALPGEYRAVLPEARHVAAGKKAGLTAHVERFGCTLRLWCARLVRQTRSYSTCPRNHVGAIWYVIRLNNASRL